MGRVLVGGSIDSTVAGYITNSGTVPFTINSVRITGPDAARFVLL